MRSHRAPETDRGESPLRVLRVVLEVLIAYLLVGVAAGLVWVWVWTPPDQVVQQHQVFYADYQSLRRVFTGTGLYVLVAAAASALTALVVSLQTRARELLVMVSVLVGSGAAAAVMREVGINRGPGDPTSLAKTAADGTPVHGVLDVSGFSPYLVWPMTSLFVLSLVFFAWPRARDTGPGQDDARGADPSEPRVTEGERG